MAGFKTVNIRQRVLGQSAHYVKEHSERISSHVKQILELREVKEDLVIGKVTLNVDAVITVMKDEIRRSLEIVNHHLDRL